MKADASLEPAHDASEEASPVEASAETAPPAEWGRPTKRRGGLGHSQARHPEATMEKRAGVLI